MLSPTTKRQPERRTYLRDLKQLRRTLAALTTTARPADLPAAKGESDPQGQSCDRGGGDAAIADLKPDPQRSPSDQVSMIGVRNFERMSNHCFPL